ncbi:MAG: OB-fold nucleic acid binding domain-containing protein [Clostridia bacterium]|nr:OB-fold nucleic acid binding domain-containing protein [Clostridia bacterium]
MDFGSVKNVGTAVVDSIVKERKEKGDFKSFTDFCERMAGESVNKKCIESLIKSGAFDEFEQTRSTLLASFEAIIDSINDTSRRTMQGQVTMFDLGKTEDEKIENMKYSFKTLKEFEEKELLSMEKEMLGIYISGHPLEKLKKEIEKISTINTYQMLQIKEQSNLKLDGKQVKYIGIITSIKKKYTKKNTLMAFLTVEDLYGTTEIIVFDSCYSNSQNILLEEKIILIEGRLSIREDEPVKIVANNITQFDEKEIEVLFSKGSKKLIINITDLQEEKKSELRGAIKFFSGKKNNIAVNVKNGDQLLPCGAVYMTEEILEEFKKIVGEERIQLQ